MLYYDLATKQIWGEGSGDEVDSHMSVDGDQLGEGSFGENIPSLPDPPVVEDFDDDDINAAARLLSVVSAAYSLSCR